MANQVYIIPRRNDLDGMNIQAYDLQPNTSLKNSIYDGAGQSGYIKWSLDAPGLTQVVGDSFNGGSTNTAPLAALTAQQTTVAPPDDVSATAAAEFGLAAYFRERVEAAVGVTVLTPVQALACATGVKALVDAGSVLTLASINAVLAGVVAGTGLLTGDSFGSVEEVIRILQGQVYQVKAHTIVADAAAPPVAFLSLGARVALVAAQANPAVTFFATGGFVNSSMPGYRAFLPLVRTGAFLGSAGEGVLFHLKQNMTWKNPNFAYSAAEVTSWRPRAVSINGTVIPETGVWPAIACYDNQGNLL